MLVILSFAVLLQAGMTMGMATGDALFLTQVGTDSLWLVFVSTPILMALLTPIYTHWMERRGINRLAEGMQWVLLVLGLLIAGLLWVREGGSEWLGWISTALEPDGFGLPAAWIEPLERAFFLAIKLYTAACYILLYTLFWNVTDSYFTIQAAKRLFPLFSAGLALGSALGAGLVTWLATRIPMAGFFLAWSGCALLAWPLLRYLGRHGVRLTETGAQDAGESRIQGSALKAFLASPFSLVLAAVLFTTLLLTNLAEYQYLEILERDYALDELAVLFGQLFVAAAIFNLIMNLFVYGWLVSRLGVRALTLVMPLVYLGTFAVLFISDQIWAAILAFWVYHGVLTSVEYNTQNLLFNAVPGEYKKSIRTYIEGLAEPSASLFSGLFLLLVAPWLDPRSIAGIGLLLAVMLLALALLLRQHYRRALAINIQTLSRLVMRHAPSDPVNAEDVLGPGARAWTPEMAARSQEPDPREALAAASAGLVSEARARGWIASAKPHLRVAAAVAHWRLGDPEHVRAATLALDRMVHQGTLSEQCQALRGYGVIGGPIGLRTLTERLDHGELQVRRAALAGLRQALAPDLNPPGMVTRLFTILESEDAESRRLALDCLGALADARLIVPILERAERLGPVERERLEEILVGWGARALLPTMRVLAEPGFGHATRRLAANVAARVDLGQAIALFDEVLDAEFARGLEALGQTAVLEAILEQEPEGDGHDWLATSRTIVLFDAVLDEELQARLPAPGRRPNVVDPTAEPNTSESARLQGLLQGWVAGTPSLRLALETLRVLRRLSAEQAGLRALEIAALAGRVPDYQSLDQALSSTNPKDRANALESIEHGLSRRHLEILHRLLAVESPLKAARRRVADRIELFQVLSRLLESPDVGASEQALALLAAIDLELPEAPTVARRLVLEAPSRLLRKAARLALVSLSEKTPLEPDTKVPGIEPVVAEDLEVGRA